MIPLQWKQQYCVEPKIIDPQHRHLLDLLNQSITCGDSPEELKSLNRALLHYARTHFRTEENLFSKFRDYREAADHIQEHQTFWTTITSLQFRIGKDPAAAHQALSAFLQHWLINHITGIDQSMIPHLRHTAIGEDHPALWPLEPFLGTSSSQAFLEAFSAREQERIKASLEEHPENLLHPFQRGELLWSTFLTTAAQAWQIKLDARTFWPLWERILTLKPGEPPAEIQPEKAVIMINTDPILWRRALRPKLLSRGFTRFILSFQVKALYPGPSFLKAAQASFPLGTFHQE